MASSGTWKGEAAAAYCGRRLVRKPSLAGSFGVEKDFIAARKHIRLQASTIWPHGTRRRDIRSPETS